MSEQLTPAPQTDTSIDRMPGRRTGRTSVRAGILAGLLVVTTACSSRTENTSGTSAPSPSETPTPTVMWDGTAPDKVPFPGRVALPNETCEVEGKRWGLDKPQPVIERNGLLLAVIDARLSFPPQCDYRVDTGAGTYKGASYDAPVQTQPGGDTKIKDGTVVSITGYSIGQGACNPSGTSSLWVQFESEVGGVDSTIPVVNMGGGPTLDQLQEHNIPAIPSPYEGTTLETC
jgi:hypothetical protein